MARSVPRHIERFIETAIFASRWVLAPFYLGLALSLIVLLIKFLFELVHIAEMASQRRNRRSFSDCWRWSISH